MASWRDLPPTEKQLQWIARELGWPTEYAKGRTRGQVADEIAALVAHRERYAAGLRAERERAQG